MRIIKIFLASSEELKNERVKIADLVENMNMKFKPLGISFQLVKWEYISATMNPMTKQEEYNEELRACEMCLVLWWRKFGMFTKEELDVAFNELCAGNNPQRLFVFFKKCEKPEEALLRFRDSFNGRYGHYPNFFASADSLNKELLLQILEYLSSILKETCTIGVHGRKLSYDGKAIIDVSGYDFFSNNEEYKLLTDNERKTERLLSVISPEDPEYVEYAGELTELKKRIANLEDKLWKMALSFVRLRSQGCPQRLERSRELFYSGNMKGAMAVLDEDTIEGDVRHHLHLIDLGNEGRSGLAMCIDEYRLKHAMVITCRDEGWKHDAFTIERRVIELTKRLYGEDYFLECDREIGEYHEYVANKYASQGDYEDALDHMIKANKILARFRRSPMDDAILRDNFESIKEFRVRLGAG